MASAATGRGIERMRITTARAAWHDAYYQPWDSVMAVAADWAKLGTSVQTTAKAVTANHAAHQALAGRVQAAIETLPLCLQAFGHHMYSPIATDADREMAEDAVFVLAMREQARMTASKRERAEYVARGVLFRYRTMNQGGMGQNLDPLDRPEAFRKWLLDVYGIELASAAWEREWGGFVEACFDACNKLDRAALAPVSRVVEVLQSAA